MEAMENWRPDVRILRNIKRNDLLADWEILLNDCHTTSCISVSWFCNVHDGGLATPKPISNEATSLAGHVTEKIALQNIRKLRDCSLLSLPARCKAPPRNKAAR